MRNDVSGGPIVLREKIQSAAPIAVTIELKRNIVKYFLIYRSSVLCEGTSITVNIEKKKAPKNQKKVTVSGYKSLFTAFPNT